MYMYSSIRGDEDLAAWRSAPAKARLKTHLQGHGSLPKSQIMACLPFLYCTVLGGTHSNAKGTTTKQPL